MTRTHLAAEGVTCSARPHGRARLALALASGLVTASPALSAVGETAPLRFFPVAAFDDEGDSIQSGVRVSRSPDGSVSVARERFEAGGVPRDLHLPAALGGGFLFYQPLGTSGAAGTALFRAADFTGELRPLGTVPFVVSSMHAGFDRLYMLGAGRAIAVDVETASYLPLDPLPPVATILDLRFDEGGRALVRAPIVGTLLTEDAGVLWARASTQAPEDSPAEDDSTPSLLPRQRRLLEGAVLRGAALPDGTVLALVAGERVAFDPTRGLLLHGPEAGLDARSRCQALPPGDLGTDRHALLWFACLAPGGKLELRAYAGARPSSTSTASAAEPGLELTRRMDFSSGTSVLGSGRLGVLLTGACPGGPTRKKPKMRALCLVTGKNERTLFAAAVASTLPETFAVGSSSVVRLSLLPDGGIRSERLDAPGSATVHRVHHEAEIESLVLGGTWLPGATVFEEGISFWAIRGESYVGVRLERDGTSARVGAIQRPLRRAFFSGKHALAWGASGFARISVDAGMTFAEVNYPFVSGDQDPSGLESADQALELGCGPAGCSLGTWVSVGWGPPLEEQVESSPPRIAVPPLGSGRFRFACAPTGTSSPLRLPPQERTAVAGELALHTAPAPAFWERPPPRPSALEIAHSVGDHRGLGRLYAFGPKEGAWGSRGRVIVRFHSPFTVEDEFESSETADLFLDGAEVQSRLGILDRMTQTAQTELDPGGAGGVMLVRTRQQATLFAFAHQSGVQRFDVPEELGLLSMAGAVLLRGRFYVGQVAGGEFRVLELTDAGPTIVGSFPLGETGPREATLVRSTAFDLGIALDGDLGLFVYPVSRQGELGDALFQPFRGSRPPHCPAVAAGYLVVRELSIAPYVEVQGDELDVSRVTMRRIVGFGPECIDALAADARGAFDPVLLRGAGVRPGGTPLAVTDRSETGRRVELSCH